MPTTAVPVQPSFLYGTAWKEDETERLTTLALQAGFRGIDTANQRKHYHEAAVGRAIASGGVPREELFLQTKFTFRPGQDERLPYDPSAPVRVQVEQSFASSLEHLGTDRVDSYVLHGPSLRDGLIDADWEAWSAMEALHASGRVGALGVSNVSLGQLDAFVRGARVRPRFVQNRCFAVVGWDYEIRRYCAANGLIYQGFSLLTANPQALADPRVAAIARSRGWTVPQVVFRFALDVGMLPLTGTSDPAHMSEDLAVVGSALDPDEVALIEGIAVRRR